MKTPESTLLFRWFEEVWNKERDSAIDEMMHPEGIAHGLPNENEHRGPEGFRMFYQSFRSDFDQIHIELANIISDGDFEAARCLVQARHKPSNTPVSFSGITMAHLRNGQLYEGWNSFDFLSLYQQLGHDLVASKRALVEDNAF
jgi:predicted ester cyclase